MSEPGARQSTSDTAEADHESEEWSALESLRGRRQFDLGQIRLPYTARVQGWKDWENLFLLFFALLCFSLGYLFFPGFSGPFEGSVLDVFLRWAVPLASFGAGAVVVIAVITAFFDTVVIKLDRSWVVVYESGDEPTFREPLANYTGVSLHQDHILLANQAGAIDKPYYLVDLDHSDNTKTIPLYRGTLLKTARERQEQACRVLRLPKVGGDFAETSAEETLMKANPLVAAAVDAVGRLKRRKQADGDRHGRE